MEDRMTTVTDVSVKRQDGVEVFGAQVREGDVSFTQAVKLESALFDVFGARLDDSKKKTDAV